MTERMEPIHPGEILEEEFMDPLDLSQNKLADDLGVSPRRINEIVNGRRGITADTALRLARYFDTTEQFWMNLQSRYDLECAQDESGTDIERTVQKRKAS